MKKYQPIKCGFHDYLEHFATLREPVSVVYQDMGRVIELQDVVIHDLSGGRDGEFIHIMKDTKEKLIRMDYLISISGINSNHFTENFC